MVSARVQRGLYHNPQVLLRQRQRYEFANRNLPREGRIVDVGCNDGRMLKILDNTRRQVRGVDKNLRFKRTL
ncbi:hypothetical protein HY992_06715 [Candidatus Micrarchaeota archaeon]|nr:hypothetical protein [Candidatus Micrarchaeota archaeon]